MISGFRICAVTQGRLSLQTLERARLVNRGQRIEPFDLAPHRLG